jgi:hypothetical protein
MTGNQLVAKLKTMKGKLYAYVPTAEDGLYLPVEKKVLAIWLEGCGDSETGMEFKSDGGSINYFTRS